MGSRACKGATLPGAGTWRPAFIIGGLLLLGEKDRAIALLQHLLEISYDGLGEAPLTPALLRLDPDFDALRKDPRFQKLCEEK